MDDCYPKFMLKQKTCAHSNWLFLPICYWEAFETNCITIQICLDTCAFLDTQLEELLLSLVLQ